MSEGQQEFSEMTTEQLSRGLRRFKVGLMCQKCGNGEASEGQLAGGYHARLCIGCRNAWHEFIREFWDVVRISRIKLELEVKVGNDIAITTAESVMKQEYNIYKISKAWANNLDAFGPAPGVGR